MTKNIYRHLLYRSLLRIRLYRSPSWWNPLDWARQRRVARANAALADALHNLAFFAANDFENFDEARFWRDVEGFEARYGVYGSSSRHVFDALGRGENVW